jgi:hypothetical protein
MVVHLAPCLGRPKRDAVDVVRTRIWFQAVKLRSGLPSAHAIEVFVDGSLPAQGTVGINRPRKWYSYKNGSSSPSAIAGKRDAVADAEALVPGTARWYHHPVWKALKGKTAQSHMVTSALRALDPDVVDILYVQDERLPGQLTQRSLGFQEMRALIDIGSFDALAAAVLLMIQSDLDGELNLGKTYRTLYQELQPVAAGLPELVTDFPALFDLTDKVCHRRHFVPRRELSSTSVPWRELPWYTTR